MLKSALRGRLLGVVLGLAMAAVLLSACETQAEPETNDVLVEDRVAALEATVRDLQSQIDNLPTPAPPTIVTVTPSPTPTPIVIPTPTPRVTPTEGVPEPLQTGTVSTGGGVLNVRAGPSLSDEILESLSDGSVISLTGKEESGTTYNWLELTNGGWVAAEFVVLDE